MAELMRTRALSTACTPLEVRIFVLFFLNKKEKTNIKFDEEHISRENNRIRAHSLESCNRSHRFTSKRDIYLYVHLLISELNLSLLTPRRAHFQTPDDQASLSQKKMNALCTKNATAMAHD